MVGARRLLGEISRLLRSVAGNLAPASDGGRHYHLLVDTTNGCNLRCTFCPRTKDRVAMMTPAELDLILAKVRPHVDSVQLSCAWEYSIAANAAQIVSILGSYDFAHTEIYSNANRLPADLTRALIEARIGVFVASIGEARKETYERLRKGGKLERVVGNLKELNRTKEEAGVRRPRLCANLTIVRSNIEELPEFVELAYRIGIEEIRGRHLILNQGLDMSEERITDGVAANLLIENARARAAGHGICFDVPPYTPEPRPKDCRAPWSQLYVSSNGDVAVCPRIHLHAKIGNLLHESFEDIVTGPRLRELQRQFTEKRFDNPVCALCLASREHDIPIDQGF